MLLAGDIGGTKTKLAIFSSQNELKTPIYEETFPSIYYTSLEALVREFFIHISISYPIEQACFGVAGPVARFIY
jgi:glucokinase